MSSRLDDRHALAREEQACREVSQHFADQLKQFPFRLEAVERLERNLSIMALAANMSASKPTDKFIEVDDGTQWHKSVDLMDNIYLCHRPITDGAEYAVVEYYQMHHANEIWNRGWNATEVLRSFVEDQRHELQVRSEDMKAQVKEYLAEKYPGQDLSRVADEIMLRLNHTVSQPHGRSEGENYNNGIRI